MTRPFAVMARELEGEPRGMNRYLREVLEAWRQDGTCARVTLYFEGAVPADFDAAGYETRSTGPGPGGGATAWEQWALARALFEDRPRALLAPASSAPLLTRTPTVVVVHDLSFEAHPEWFSTREGARRRLLARAGVRQARSLVADSAFTAAELERLYGVRAARVRVVPCGISERFRPAPGELPVGLDGELVLSVGSLFNRRHVPELVTAFARVVAERSAARLVLVGDNRTHPRLDLERLLAEHGVRERATLLDRVDDPTLAVLYSRAAVTVYLSDYEGFGLPPLEALACGSPVVASKTSALAENLEGRATLLDTHDPAAIAAAILDSLAAPPLRVRPPWADLYAWPRTALALAAALEEAAT